MGTVQGMRGIPGYNIESNDSLVMMGEGGSGLLISDLLTMNNVY